MQRGAMVGDQREVAAFYAMVSTARRIICYWCGKPVPKGRRVVDHIKPVSKQGPHAALNLCASCGFCNGSKAAKEAASWSGQGLLDFQIGELQR